MSSLRDCGSCRQYENSLCLGLVGFNPSLMQSNMTIAKHDTLQKNNLAITHLTVEVGNPTNTFSRVKKKSSAAVTWGGSTESCGAERKRREVQGRLAAAGCNWSVTNTVSSRGYWFRTVAQLFVSYFKGI